MKKPLTRWANQGLPSYSDERLAQLDAAALIDLLVADEDRVPRNVIDAAAHLGEPIVVGCRNVSPFLGAKRHRMGNGGSGCMH